MRVVAGFETCCRRVLLQSNTTINCVPYLVWPVADEACCRQGLLQARPVAKQYDNKLWTTIGKTCCR